MAKGVRFGSTPNFAGLNNPRNAAGGGPKRSPQLQPSSTKLLGQGKVPKTAGGPLIKKGGKGRAMAGRALKGSPTAF